MARDYCLKQERWTKTKDVTTVEMKGVLLMEQFMNKVPHTLKYELISHKVKDVMEAGHRATVIVKPMSSTLGGENQSPTKVMVIRDIGMTTR